MPLARLVIAFAPALLAVTTWAQQPEAGPPQAEGPALLEVIIRDLASDDVTLRIDAQRRLTDASSIRLRDIENAARTRTLSPEQRRRLASAAYVRFCTEPRAGMGVQSGIDVGERGILLQSVLPGFPAAEVLRSGDRLLSVDGQAINDIIMMRPVVIAHDPGDEVPVTVVRGGSTINLKVKLGRFNDLNSRDRFQITADVLDEAWAFRSAAFADPAEKSGPPPIDSGLPPSAWQIVGTPDVTMDFNDGGDPNVDPRVRVDARRLQNPDAIDSGLVAAGEARGAGSQIRWAPAQGGMPNIRIAPNMDVPRIGPNNADAQAEIDRLRAIRLSEIRNEQARLRQRVQNLLVQIAGAGEADRKALLESLDLLQRRINELEILAQPGQRLDP